MAELAEAQHVPATAASAVCAPEAANSFEAVMEADLEFRTAEAGHVFDAAAEAAALARLFEGASRPALAAALASTNQAHKFDGLAAAWRSLGDSAGAAAGAVVERLGAPHLRPSGIEARLNAGMPAACFGLVTLLANAASKGN